MQRIENLAEAMDQMADSFNPDGKVYAEILVQYLEKKYLKIQ